MTVDTQKLRDHATDAVAEALGDAYDCTRVWNAWGYGTMSQDDFCLVTDDDSRLAEITEAALNPAMAVIDAQVAEIERLKKALRVAVLALAHATEEHGKVYEPAYDAVQTALYGDPDAS